MCQFCSPDQKDDLLAGGNLVNLLRKDFFADFLRGSLIQDKHAESRKTVDFRNTTSFNSWRKTGVTRTIEASMYDIILPEMLCHVSVFLFEAFQTPEVCQWQRGWNSDVLFCASPENLLQTGDEIE